MKIYNKITLEWNKETQNYDNVVYEDSYEYEGEIMHAFPKKSPISTTPIKNKKGHRDIRTSPKTSTRPIALPGSSRDLMCDPDDFAITIHTDNTVWMCGWMALAWAGSYDQEWEDSWEFVTDDHEQSGYPEMCGWLPCPGQGDWDLTNPTWENCGGCTLVNCCPQGVEAGTISGVGQYAGCSAWWGDAPNFTTVLCHINDGGTPLGHDYYWCCDWPYVCGDTDGSCVGAPEYGCNDEDATNWVPNCSYDYVPGWSGGDITYEDFYDQYGFWPSDECSYGCEGGYLDYSCCTYSDPDCPTGNYCNGECCFGGECIRCGDTCQCGYLGSCNPGTPCIQEHMGREGGYIFDEDVETSGGSRDTNHDLIVYMFDCYGDGWNGNSLHFGGSSFTITSGHSGESTVTLANGNYTGIYCSGGSWSAEATWMIYEPLINKVHMTGSCASYAQPYPTLVLSDHLPNDPVENYTSGCGTMTDYDGNEYPAVLIGNQCWISENLKTTKYRNGTAIDYVGGGSEWSADWCLIPDNCNTAASGKRSAYWGDPTNATDYGYLYNYCAVHQSIGLCQENWHVPTDEEWMELEMALGMDAGDSDYNIGPDFDGGAMYPQDADFFPTNNNCWPTINYGMRSTSGEGAMLKEIDGEAGDFWFTACSGGGECPEPPGGTGCDCSGFDAIPGGMREGGVMTIEGFNIWPNCGEYSCGGQMVDETYAACHWESAAVFWTSTTHPNYCSWFCTMNINDFMYPIYRAVFSACSDPGSLPPNCSATKIVRGTTGSDYSMFMESMGWYIEDCSFVNPGIRAGMSVRCMASCPPLTMSPLSDVTILEDRHHHVDLGFKGACSFDDINIDYTITYPDENNTVGLTLATGGEGGHEPAYGDTDMLINPDDNDYGVAEVTVKAYTDYGYHQSRTFTVTVTPVSDYPTCTNTSFSYPEDQDEIIFSMSSWCTAGGTGTEEDAISHYNLTDMFYSPEAGLMEGDFHNGPGRDVWVPGTLYGFNGTYVQLADMEPGYGYWAVFDTDGVSPYVVDTYCTEETLLNEPLTIQLISGWNLIGGLGVPANVSDISDPESIIIAGTVYEFNGEYDGVEVLTPGKGYWINTSNDGSITINPPSDDAVPYEGWQQHFTIPHSVMDAWNLISIACSSYAVPGTADCYSGCGGTVYFYPWENWSGEVKIPYQAIAEGNQYSIPKYITITHLPVGDAPVLIDTATSLPIGNQTITEDSSVTLTLQATSVDYEDLLTYTAYTNNTNVTAVISSGQHHSGDEVQLVISGHNTWWNYGGATVDVTVIVQGIAVNEAQTVQEFLVTVNQYRNQPECDNIDVNVDENGVLDIYLSNACSLVAFEEEIDSYTVVSNVTNGTLEQPDPSNPHYLVYTPDQWFHGEDSFIFKAHNGTANRAASVFIAVNEVDETPAITAVSNQEINENESLVLNLHSSVPAGSSIDQLEWDVILPAEITGTWSDIMYDEPTLTLTPSSNWNTYSHDGNNWINTTRLISLSVTNNAGPTGSTDTEDFYITVTSVSQVPVAYNYEVWPETDFDEDSQFNDIVITIHQNQIDQPDATAPSDICSDNAGSGTQCLYDSDSYDSNVWFDDTYSPGKVAEYAYLGVEITSWGSPGDHNDACENTFAEDGSGFVPIRAWYTTAIDNLNSAQSLGYVYLNQAYPSSYNLAYPYFRMDHQQNLVLIYRCENWDEGETDYTFSFSYRTIECMAYMDMATRSAFRWGETSQGARDFCSDCTDSHPLKCSDIKTITIHGGET